jgi:hypothetical protein
MKTSKDSFIRHCTINLYFHICLTASFGTFIFLDFYYQRFVLTSQPIFEKVIIAILLIIAFFLLIVITKSYHSELKEFTPNPNRYISQRNQNSNEKE